MKKFFKALLITGLIAAVLFGALIAAVIIMFPPEKIKTILLTEISEFTGRKAEINDLKINIFKGIEVNGFVLYEADSATTFISDGNLFIKYSIPAIFKGTLLITELKLNEPYFSIIKTGQNTWNYSDIVININERLSGRKKRKSTAKEFPVIVTQLAIKGGTVNYADLSREKPLKASIEKLYLNSENILLSALKPVAMKVSGDIIYSGIRLPFEIATDTAIDVMKGDVKIAIKKMSLAGTTTTGDISIIKWKDIDSRLNTDIDTALLIKQLPENYSQKLGGIKTNVVIKNSLNFSVKSKVMSFTDKIMPASGLISYNDRPVAEKLGGSVVINEKYGLKGDIKLNLAGSPVTVAISGSNINKLPLSSYNLSIRSPKFALEYLLGLMPVKKGSDAEMTAQQKTEKTKKAVAKLKNTVLPGLYINLNADSVTFREITFGKTIANIRLVSGKLYSEAAILAYSGNINSNITADIKKETYNATVIVKKVMMDNFVNDAIAVIPKKDAKKKSLLDEIKGKASGKLDLKAVMNGASFTDIAHTIKGIGNFSVNDGKLTSLDTARDLAKKTGLKFLNEDITFDIMAADYSMSKGRIDISNFRILTGPDGNDGNIKVKGSGYVTVDKALDLKFLTDLNPESSKEIESMLAKNFGIKDASYGYNKDGWMPFDFRLYGSLTDKKYDYSQPRLLENIKRNLTKKVQEQGTKYLQDEGGKLLKKLFNK